MTLVHPTLKIEQLLSYTETASAIRRIRRLQPIGGEGSYVAPPTYNDKDKNPIHVFEKRRINGRIKQCVLLDSVQSQANRLEEALSAAITTGELKIPNVEVDFGDLGLGVISALEAPHRIFDAIIRDSALDGIDFPETEMGMAINVAKPHNATALFKSAPATLVFGGWNSTGDLGGNGPKFQRCLVSEIVGVDVPTRNIGNNNTETVVGEGKKPASRLDPLSIEKIEIYRSKTHRSKWELEKRDGYEKSKPSEVNHGNIIRSIVDQGVTMEYALQTTTLTLAGLRRLRFPVDRSTEQSSHARKYERNIAAWTALAALALCAVTRYDVAGGLSLRSRCDLYPEGKSSFEIIHNDGAIEKVELTAEDAKKLLEESVKNAIDKCGLSWHDEPVRLKPQEKLIKLVNKSRGIA